MLGFYLTFSSRCPYLSMQRLRVMECIGHMSHYSIVSNAISKKKFIRSRDQNLKSNRKTFLRILISRDVSFSFETSFTPHAKKQRCSCCLFSICVCVFEGISNILLFLTYMFNVSSGICLELAAKFHCLWLQYFVGYAPRLYIFI